MQALQNNDITIYGDGEQTRSFCFVDDLLDGIQLFMNSEDDFRGPVNLGNPIQSTILELAQKIISLTGSNSRIINEPIPEDDPKKRQPDISLAMENLNWEPKIELDDGLERTIKYFSEIIKN